VDPGQKIAVRQGDTTASIAYAHGHFWETVWNHPANEELRNLRKDPNILREGDKIFVPDLRQKSASCATNARRTFQLKGVPEKLRIRLLDWEDSPRKSMQYQLTLDDGTKKHGTTDADGWIDAWIPPNTSRAKIRVTDGEELIEVLEVELGHMDPIQFCTGICDRLRNL
jgi:hypothetical protein